MGSAGSARSLALAAAALLIAAAHPHAQFEKMISATFDGWNKLPDGSYELVFGYINRNATEVEVPLGPANLVEPGPDRGQPTNFLPGRQRAAFRIPVPAGFKGRFVWTLAYGGMTQVANASIDQNYSLDVGDPDPPHVKAGTDLTVPLSGVAHLTPSVSPPVPAPVAATSADVVPRRSSGARIMVWWSKFRGPGRVTFGDGQPAEATAPGPTGREVAMGTFRMMCAAPLTSACGATDARFSAPGTYWLRVVAAERSASNAVVKVVVTP